jgi:hypothetical protein
VLGRRSSPRPSASWQSDRIIGRLKDSGHSVPWFLTTFFTVLSHVGSLTTGAEGSLANQCGYRCSDRDTLRDIFLDVATRVGPHRDIQGCSHGAMAVYPCLPEVERRCSGLRGSLVLHPYRLLGCQQKHHILWVLSPCRPGNST